MYQENIPPLIKATTTTATLAATYSGRPTIALIGGKWYKLSNSLTLNMATSGMGGLDTGTFAANTQYYVYLVADSIGNVGLCASTSPTAPTGFTNRNKYIAKFRSFAASAAIADITTDFVGSSYNEEDPIVDEWEKNYCTSPSSGALWIADSGMTISTETTLANLPRQATTKGGIKFSSSTDEVAGKFRFTLDAADKGKKLKIHFDQKVLGSYAEGDYRVEMWTNTAADFTGTWSEVPLSTDDASGTSSLPRMTGTYWTTFDTTTADYYEFRVVRNVGTPGVIEIVISDVIIGPGLPAQGAIVGEWAEYTPTFASGFALGTGGTTSFQYRRVGSAIEIRGRVFIGTTSGNWGTTGFTATLPSGHTADISSPKTNRVGVCQIYTGTVQRIPGYVVAAATNISVFVPSSGTSTDATALSGAAAANSELQILVSIPIVEFVGSGTVNISQNDVEFASHTGTARVVGPIGSLPPSNIGTFRLFDAVSPHDVLQLEVGPRADGQMVPGEFVTAAANSNASWAASNTEARSMAPFGGRLYVGTQNTGGAAAQVWSYDNSVWTNVSPTWASANTHAISAAVFGSRLYVGTSNSGGAQVWRYDGSSWADVSPGWLSANVQARSMAAFGGFLYVGTQNSGGAQVWRYDGSAWLNVTPGWPANNTHVSSTAVFGGFLYVGTVNPSIGAQVWRYDGAAWSDASPPWGVANSEAASMAAFGRFLYVGTQNIGGAQVWRYDGSAWSNVTPGWASANTHVHSMTGFGGWLYAGTVNGGGAQVWRYDGSAWSSIVPGWLSANTSARSMAVFSGRLYVGTLNSGGAQVWVRTTYRPQIYVQDSAGYIRFDQTSDLLPDYWRVRRSSGGQAVGFGLASTSSAGLVSSTTQTLGGAKTFAGPIAVARTEHNITGGTHTAIPSTTSFLRVSTTAAWTLAGIVAGHDGQEFVVYNKDGFNMSINNEDSGAPAANRILTMSGGTLSTTGAGVARFIYDGSAQRWILVSLNT